MEDVACSFGTQTSYRHFDTRVASSTLSPFDWDRDNALLWHFIVYLVGICCRHVPDVAGGSSPGGNVGVGIDCGERGRGRETKRAMLVFVVLVGVRVVRKGVGRNNTTGSKERCKCVNALLP